MSRRVSPSEQGALQGAMASLTSLADGTGPFVFGLAYSALVTAGASGPASGLVVLAGAVVMLAAFAIALVVVRPPVAANRVW